MRTSQIVLLVFMLAILCPAQQTKIVIRLMNGKSGKPIRDRSFNVWLGNRQMSLLNADSKGEIELDVASVEPHELRVSPNTKFDCRSKHDFSRGDLIKYSLNDIISKGVVGENLCGKAAALPTPGVLTIFLRARTFIEGMRL